MKAKLSLLSVIFLLLTISCTETVDSKKNATQADKTAILTIGSVKFKVVPISKKEFLSNVKTTIEQTERSLLNEHSSTVVRQQDSLIFQLNNNNKFILRNDSSDDEDAWAIYHFAGTLHNIGYWYVDVTYYEWWNTILVNQQNGDTTITIGKPCVSPDKKFIMCGNVDLTAGFTANGLELYRLTNGKLVLIGLCELDDWGPKTISWKNANTIFIEQTRVNENLKEYSTFCKLIKM